MKAIIQLKWSETMRINNWANQNMTVAQSPFGEYDIKWSSPQIVMVFGLFFNGDQFGQAVSLPNAKEMVRQHFESKVNDCFVVEDPIEENRRIHEMIEGRKAWVVGMYFIGHQEWNKMAVWMCHRCNRSNPVLVLPSLHTCMECNMEHWVEKLTLEGREKARSNYKQWENDNVGKN